MATSIQEAKLGAKVAAVDGPGQVAEHNDRWTIVAREDDRWGTFLVVESESGEREAVSSFTDIGIGWYYLG